MKDLFVPYEIAVQLKEIGFNEPCLKVGNTNEHIMWKCIEVDADDEAIDVNDILNVEYGEQWTSIPLFSQCFKWFQEKFELTSWIYNSNTDEFFFTIVEKGRYVKAHNSFPTSKEAEIACLGELIKIIKNKI